MEELRTDDELDEEENVHYEQKGYACFAGYRGRMQARQRRKNVADTARGHVDAGDGVKVLRLPAVLAPSVEGTGLDLPDHGLAILAGGGDDRVVEGRPVRIENGPGVAAGEGHEVG